jgi:hypothetical protein
MQWLKVFKDFENRNKFIAIPLHQKNNWKLIFELLKFGTTEQGTLF